MSPWSTALILVGGATALRVFLLFFSQLELYPDEAQYWVWSRDLAFGYFSKPPMIAWLIRATTTIGGDGEAWIRLSAPLLHGGSAIVLYRAARRLYGERAGLWASILYTLVPGVQLSSSIMATDAPLMLFLALALWAYATFWREDDKRGRCWPAVGLGAALGAAFLTKYAALYIAGGVVLHALVSSGARRRWDWTTVCLSIGAGGAIAAPNLIWNLAHHFQTVAHTAENADLNADRGLTGLIGARGPFGFLIGQFGVFGPIPFAVVIAGVVQAFRRRGMGADTLLICLAAPAFLLVLGESIIARANANWAGAGYGPCIVLAAGLLERWRATRLRAWAFGTQLVVALGFLAGVSFPGLADTVGAGNAFKRARGWRADTVAIIAAARTAQRTTPLTAIAVDDRFLFNALSYYGRDSRGAPAAALPTSLRAWIHLARAENQAEAEAPLTPQNGERVLAIGATPEYLAAFKADFQTTASAAPPRITIQLDPRHDRSLDLFVGEHFAARPRDPSTGRPIGL
jgi:4-amino-4-deoxy-L-arabinose transferase-like glycosyltransferase